MSSVFYAATDLESRVCGPEPVAIVGGGNSAGQTSVFLSRHQRNVYLVVRSYGLGAAMSRYLIDQVQRSPNITLSTSSEVRELVGEGALTAVVLANNRTGERQTLPVGALLVFIGAASCTAGSSARDAHGFVLTGQAARTAAGSP